MIGKLLPVLLPLIGIGAGVAAGVFMQPAQDVAVLAQAPCGEVADGQAVGEHAGADAGAAHQAAHEYVKLNNQFIIPVVKGDRVAAMVVLSLSVETGAGGKEEIYQREPKLRDAFLQVLFDHANMGGFQGAFTNSSHMDILRNALRETAHKVVGDLISDVLIIDINRQDV
ncbi:flagellar basal body-associated FliL family protein [Aquicoccus sp. G2-2]|uniref:flagellar basal body-associated FliL family protein n=1 Tax=Aquicoccus sp. G2-2 TaxID=3092120 RepID=UPI002ADFA72C|nr:flagellar basal body-associated FliL family protein [Aquicoccus sp. G2-2]MEA1114399.1 flagellar basal body-associated FliL family protein [Aquicoccus sp. G2-2]